MPLQKVNDINIFYQQSGAGEDLVLIAGVTADHHTWDPVYDELTKHYRVLRFDNRGAGLTDAPDADYTMRQMADDVIGLLDVLNIKQAYIVGHSMGGHITQQLAIHYPERIHKAMLICSRAKASAAATMFLKCYRQLFTLGIETKLLLTLLAAYLHGNDFMSEQKNIDAYINFILTVQVAQKPAGFRGQSAAGRRYNALAELSSIRVAVKVIGCEEDSITPVFNSQMIAAQIPGAELVVVKNSGHMLQFEKPLECVKLIREFCC